MSYTNYSDAFANFAEIADAIKAQYGSDDIIALREGWNDYTDSLCKDDEFSDLQYNHCPAYDDTMPDGDSDMAEYLLESMGFTFRCGPLQTRRDDGLMTDMNRHFRCTISRNSRSYEFYFSQGDAHTAAPELSETLSCLMSDASSADESFEDWCANYGYDDDSRKAFAMYERCKETREWLLMLMSVDEMEQLAEHFSDAGY